MLFNTGRKAVERVVFGLGMKACFLRVRGRLGLGKYAFVDWRRCMNFILNFMQIMRKHAF